MKQIIYFLKKWWTLFAFLSIAAVFGISHALISNLNISLFFMLIIAIAGAFVAKLVKSSE